MAQFRNVALEHIFEGAPAAVLSGDAKKRLEKLCRQIDKLGRVKPGARGGHIEEKALRKLLKDFGSSKAETLVDHIKGKPNHRLVDDTQSGGGLVQASWFDLAGNVDELEPAPNATMGELQLGPNPSDAQMQAALKARFPTVPSTFFQPGDIQTAIEKFIDSLKEPQPLAGTAAKRSGDSSSTAAQFVAPTLSQVFDCLWANLGWWAAIGVCLAIASGFVAFSLSTAAGGPLAGWLAWQVFWWLLVVSLGAWTATVVGNCIFDTGWRI